MFSPIKTTNGLSILYIVYLPSNSPYIAWLCDVILVSPYYTYYYCGIGRIHLLTKMKPNFISVDVVVVVIVATKFELSVFWILWRSSQSCQSQTKDGHVALWSVDIVVVVVLLVQNQLKDRAVMLRYQAIASSNDTNNVPRASLYMFTKVMRQLKHSMLIKENQTYINYL